MTHCPHVRTAARLGERSVGPFAVWLAALWIAGALCSPAIAQDGAQEHPRALLDKIREQKDRSPAALFEALGTRRDALGFRTLESALVELKSEHALTLAATAFRHFAAVADQAPKALSVLETLAMAKAANEARAGAKGLCAFGPDANGSLRNVIQRANDDVARAIALAPLVEGLATAPDAAGLELWLKAWRAPQSSTATRGIEVLQHFRTDAFLKQMNKVVADEGAYRPRRELILAAVAAMKLEGDAATEADNLVERGLISPVDSIRYRALEAVIARGRAVRTGSLEDLSRVEAAELRRLAHVALARLALRAEGDTPVGVLELARAKDPAARQAAAFELARIGSEEALTSLRALLADSDARVRSEAIRAVAARRRASSIVALIDRLEAETGKLQLEAYWALRMLTGLDHGSRAPRWKSWWQGEGARFQIPTLAEADAAERKREEKQGEGTTKASFYGIAVVSDRLVFVIDISSSMLAKAYGDRTRIDVAKEELATVIGRLHGDDLFNIIAFSTGVVNWERELTAATPKNREGAQLFVERLMANGGTAIYTALERAFSDARIDTIYFLSDGDPSAGAITDPGEIQREVARWNSARHVTIHCIAVGQDHPLLRGLASDSGGTYRRIR